MEAVRQYLLSVTAAAIVCSIINRVIGKTGTYAAIVKLITGLFLVFTVISPFAKLQITDLPAYMDSLTVDADLVVMDGQQAARDAVTEIIKAEAEAYILDKASLYEAELVVDIEMGAGEMPVPESIRIQGSISPYGRMQLQQLLTEEFGIPKEQQIWIG